jgi:hypothetical protein
MSRWWKKFKVKQKKTTPDFNKRRKAFRGVTRKMEVESIQKDLKEITGKKEKMASPDTRGDTVLSVERAIIKDPHYKYGDIDWLKKASKAIKRTRKHLDKYEDIYKKK